MAGIIKRKHSKTSLKKRYHLTDLQISQQYPPPQHEFINEGLRCPLDEKISPNSRTLIKPCLRVKYSPPAGVTSPINQQHIPHDGQTTGAGAPELPLSKRVSFSIESPSQLRQSTSSSSISMETNHDETTQPQKQYVAPIIPFKSQSNQLEEQRVSPYRIRRVLLFELFQTEKEFVAELETIHGRLRKCPTIATTFNKRERDDLITGVEELFVDHSCFLLELKAPWSRWSEKSQACGDLLMTHFLCFPETFLRYFFLLLERKERAPILNELFLLISLRWRHYCQWLDHLLHFTRKELEDTPKLKTLRQRMAKIHWMNRIVPESE